MRRNVLRGATAVLCLFAGSFAACGDDSGGGGSESGTGKITFTSWGEEYIEQEIPAAELADGWSVKYAKFIVSVGNIRVGDAEGAEAARKDGFFVINHVTPGVKPLVAFDAVEAKNWDRVSYQVAPPTASAQVELVGGATEADRDLLIQSSCHLYVEGTLAKSGEDSKTFKWCLGLPTLLDECQGEVDGKLTLGAVVTDGGEDQIELTIHGDHLFYDNLQSPDALVKAQVYVDADGADGTEPDGEITLVELEAVDLDDLPPDAYGTGSATGIENLRDYVTFSSRTVGHFRGEGECFVKDPG